MSDTDKDTFLDTWYAKGSKLLFLDFETYSNEPIKNGLGRYFADPAQRPVLMAAIGMPHGLSESMSFNYVIDMINPITVALDEVKQFMDGAIVVAHNAAFEYYQLEKLGLAELPLGFIDTQSLAVALGFSPGLQRLTEQLSLPGKLSVGADLIRLFCVPRPGQTEFDVQIWDSFHGDRQRFMDYAQQDAQILPHVLRALMDSAGIETFEQLFQVWSPLDWQITQEMNSRGWFVDLDMLSKYEESVERQKTLILEEAEVTFGELNFRSAKQLIQAAKDRGVVLKATNKDYLPKARTRIVQRLSGPLASHVRKNLLEVLQLIDTKIMLGGSSVQKLSKFREMTTDDGFLRDQYRHCGAGQTHRSTSEGVQLQNLPRFGTFGPADIDVPAVLSAMTLEDLGSNLRQLLTSRFAGGALIVGDLSSIESRMLALLAGADDKLETFRRGLDMYKTLAAKINKISYSDVTQSQRQFGKVGELSCGYQAGPAAVKDFAEKMGVLLSLQEATTLVYDWRGANPEIEELWQLLQECLDEAMRLPYGRSTHVWIGPNKSYCLKIRALAPVGTLPKSSRTLVISLSNRDGHILTRVFHGAEVGPHGITYHKARSAMSGDLWRNWYVNPKTKQRTPITIYGGKLSGILTQSSAREVFFEILRSFKKNYKGAAYLVGQFHDEIILDHPSRAALDKAQRTLRELMTTQSQLFPELPLGAEVKAARRYIK